MGKDLHYSILKFFGKRMNEHSMVREILSIKNDDDYLFLIKRFDSLSDVTVHLSDSYIYTLHDYYSKPSILKSGDYILIARPEAEYTLDAFDSAKDDKIGLGKIGEFMSALNKRDIWKVKKKRKDST